MTELKTLKDFGYEDVAGYKGMVYTDKELKQKAIEWINQLKKCSKEDYSCEHDNDFHFLFGNFKNGDSLSQNECIALKDWIKMFFNITDEELE